MQVANALFKQGVVVELTRVDQQLAAQDSRAGRPVKNIEQLEQPIAPREDLLVDDIDVAHDLSARTQVDLQSQRLQFLVEGFLLEPAQQGPSGVRLGFDAGSWNDRRRLGRGNPRAPNEKYEHQPSRGKTTEPGRAVVQHGRP